MISPATELSNIQAYRMKASLEEQIQRSSLATVVRTDFTRSQYVKMREDFVKQGDHEGSVAFIDCILEQGRLGRIGFKPEFS